MSSPTKLTITSITAESGSSTQPRSTAEEPKRIQVKFDGLANSIAVQASRRAHAQMPRCEIRSEIPSEPMESVAAACAARLLQQSDAAGCHNGQRGNKPQNSA